MTLKRAIAIKRQAETILIESPLRDLRANGSAKRVALTWAQVKTIRHYPESRIKIKVPEPLAGDVVRRCDQPAQGEKLRKNKL